WTRKFLTVCAVAAVSDRTTRVTARVQFASELLKPFARSALSFHCLMSPPSSRDTITAVNWRFVGLVPPQSAACRLTSIATADAAIGNDMIGAETSEATGYGAGFGWNGGASEPKGPHPSAPGLPLSEASVDWLYGNSLPQNASVRQLAASRPVDEPTVVVTPPSLSYATIVFPVVSATAPQ